MSKSSFFGKLDVKRGFGLLAVVALVTWVASPAQAVIIDLKPSAGPTTDFEVAGPRGVFFTTGASSFTIISVGVEAPLNLVDDTFDVFIYEGNSAVDNPDLDVDAAAAVTNFTPAQDSTWFDVAFAFNFASNTDYSLIWRPNDQVFDSSWVTANPALYGLNINTASEATTTAGSELTLKGGLVGFDGEDANFLALRFRFNAIPEPNTAILGLFGSLILLRRQTRRAA